VHKDHCAITIKFYKTIFFIYTLKIDSSHFKAVPSASVGGVEIGASRLSISQHLPTLESSHPGVAELSGRAWARD
jgi:hypothetical protein